MISKWCLKCKEFKLASEFHRSSQHGLQNRCKACVKLHDAEPEVVTSRAAYNRQLEVVASRAAYNRQPETSRSRNARRRELYAERKAQWEAANA